MKSESDAARIRGVKELAARGDDVDILYRTSRGSKKRRRCEVKGPGHRMKLVAPDGSEFDITGTALKSSQRTLRSLSLVDTERSPLEEATTMLSNHNRVESVRPAGGEWVVEFVGNCPPLYNFIEELGGDVVERADSPFKQGETRRCRVRFPDE